MTDATAARELPAAHLWEDLRDVLRTALALFGEPRTLFEDLALPCIEARQLRAWIASLEATARALLFALAATLPAPRPVRRLERRATPQPTPPAAEAPITVNAPVTDSADPETVDLGSIAFRMAPRSPGGGPSGPAGGSRRFLFVRGLARRFEAVIRVAENPERYARRLARRLHADPGLADRALRPPTGDGRRPPPYADLVAEALAAARDGLSGVAPETG